jgi:outer membrane protein TolC
MLKQTELLNNLNVQRLKNAYYPSIAIFGNVFENLNRNNLFSSQESGFLMSSLVGIQANIPIFDGFSKKAKIEKAMVDRDKFTQQLEMFERSVALQIQNARQAYFKAQNTLTKRKETLILAEKIYNTTKIKFKEGVGGSLDVTNAEREFFAAQNNVLNAQYDLLNAQYDLLQAYGKL